jgi:N-acyl-L-homoserine lactone synthetase
MMPVPFEAKASPPSLEWSWHQACGVHAEPPAWLTELRQLRGRVLFDNGRRPEFGQDGRRFGDPDESDLHSAHVVARCRGAVVGCVRLTPIMGAVRSVTEQTIGSAKLEALLAAVGAEPSEVIEHGRWIVDHAYKHLGTGLYLMCASFALAYKLGFPCSVATASRDVVPLLERAGARRAPGLPLVRSELFNDEVAILYGDQRQYSPAILAQFERMAKRMGLGKVYGV